jgi:hypothetical protein
MNVILRCEITSLKEAEECLDNIQHTINSFVKDVETVSVCVTRYRLYNREGGSIYNAKDPKNINAHIISTIEVLDDDEVPALMQHIKDELELNYKLFTVIACLDNDVEDILENVI